MKIHPTAIIDPKAELHESVEVGPYSIIEGNVSIQEGTIIESHVKICAGSEIGKFNRFHQGAVIGVMPQDLGFNQQLLTKTVIGDHNIFREYSNIHKGTKEDSPTVIGNKNYFMGNSHVGHDCILGNNNILTHGCVLAGHVTLGNFAFISGLAAVHQFCFVGDYSMVAGLAKVVQDVPPYSTVDGNPSTVVGLNSVGMKRAGFSPDVRNAIKHAYKLIYHSGMSTRKALDELEASTDSIEQVKYIIKFFRDSDRGVTDHR